MFCHQFKFVTICQLHDFNLSDFVWIETDYSYIIPAMNKTMIWMWLYLLECNYHSPYWVYGPLAHVHCNPSLLGYIMIVTP
jgi:hypothetical protein